MQQSFSPQLVLFLVSLYVFLLFLYSILKSVVWWQESTGSWYRVSFRGTECGRYRQSYVRKKKGEEEKSRKNTRISYQSKKQKKKNDIVVIQTQRCAAQENRAREIYWFAYLLWLLFFLEGEKYFL